MSFFWKLIPNWVKLLILAVIVAGIMAAYNLAIYRADETGYNRCQGEHTAAIAAQKDEARPKIVESGKKYEKIKKRIKGKRSSDAVGPAVSDAIDSMP